MSNSSLVDCTMLSPNHSGKRTHRIDRITPHCVVGQATAERIGECFISESRQASCNYGIGKTGRVVLCVDEGNRSWCSSSEANDQRAVTIECASDNTEPYKMNNEVYSKLKELCVDICKRNGIDSLLWFNDKTVALNYEPKSNEAVLTVHRWFANKSCPGDWLYNRLNELATAVTNELQMKAPTVLYKIQVGAYKSLLNANAQKLKLKLKGYDSFITHNSDGIHRIQVGAFKDRDKAVALVTKLQADGFDSFIKME